MVKSGHQQCFSHGRKYAGLGNVCCIWNIAFCRSLDVQRDTCCQVSPSLRNSSCPAWLSGAINQALSAHLLSTFMSPLSGGLYQAIFFPLMSISERSEPLITLSCLYFKPKIWDYPCGHSTRTDFVDESSRPWFPILHAPTHWLSLSKLHRKKTCQLWHASRNWDEVFRKEIGSISNVK